MAGPIVGHFESLSGSMGQSILFSSLGTKLTLHNVAMSDMPFVRTCDVLLIALTPSVKDIAHAKQIMAQLVAQGIPREKMRFYGRQMGCPGGISQRIIEDELGPLLSAWPFDPELVMQCENENSLIWDKRPRSPLAKALLETVEKIKTMLRTLSPGVGTSDGFSFATMERDISNGLWQRLQNGSQGNISKQIDLEIEACWPKSVCVGPEMMTELRRRVRENVLGYGPMQKWMDDGQVNEIMVNAGTIYVEKEGRLVRTADVFENEKQLRTVIDRMVVRSGRRVDLSSPMVDVRLSDGSRVNIILPPLSLNGPAVTVRKFCSHFRSMDDLIENQSVLRETAEKLKRAVQDRKNIVIAGNTGSGKTTLLNILSGYIPAGERIITLEDTAELNLQQQHVVRLETRSRNAEGAGGISMSELLVNALRMRPDRLIIGECRGVEVVPMIQSMNTGHDGGLTTVHANSAEDAVRRLEAMVSMAVPQWSAEFVREQLASALDVMVYVKRDGAARKVTELAALGFGNGRIELVPM